MEARYTHDDVAMVMEIRDRLPECLRYIRGATIELESTESPCDTITVGDYSIVAIEVEVETPRIGGSRKRTEVRHEVYVAVNVPSYSRWEPDDTDLKLIDCDSRTLGDAFKVICLSEMGAMVESVIDAAYRGREEREIKESARTAAIGTVRLFLGPDGDRADAEAVFDYLHSTGDVRFDAMDQEFKFTRAINFDDALAAARNLAQRGQA